jgi:hypothetical protein
MDKYGDILIIRPDIENIFNDLSLDEKILVYYLYHAFQPTNRIYSGQIHRYAPEIIDLFKFVYHKIDRVHDNVLFKEIEQYYVFLLTNHSQYSIREAMTKKTPSMMGLTELTSSSLKNIAVMLGYVKEIDHILPHIFDSKLESVLVVDQSINKSHVGHYGPDFKQADFNKVPLSARGVNKYYTKDKIYSYSTKDRNEKEMTETHQWISQAIVWANTSKTIDEKIKKTLMSLGAFIMSGKEDDLKQLNINWSEMDSKIDFLFGPYEVYTDPMHIIGAYAAEITLQIENLAEFRKMWPKLERLLPFHNDHKREVPHPGNISVRTKLYAAGSNGPLRMVAAYCLPNDDDLRKTHTKQVIYYYPPDLRRSVKSNKTDYRELRHISHNLEIYRAHDENQTLEGYIWNVHVILHETVGHAAGKLSDGIFNQDLPYLIKDDFNSMEELRAEINAGWISVEGYEDLKKCFPTFAKWDKELGPQLFKTLLLTELMNDGLRRLANLPQPMKSVEGAHARANLIIMNYLLNYGGVEIVEEDKRVGDKTFLVVGCKINDVYKVIAGVKELCQKVQEIKSTGHGVANSQLFKWYSNNPIGIEKLSYYSQKLKEKNDYLNDNTSIVADVYPTPSLVVESGKIKNVVLKWNSIFGESIKQETFI